MKKEDKELLIKDLCGRLPYGVKIELKNTDPYHHENIAKVGDITIDKLIGFDGKYFRISHDNPLDWDWYVNEIDIEDIKPYLYPLSSMTEEQKGELFKLCEFCIQEDWEGKKSEVYAIEIASRPDPAYCYDHNFYLWNIDMGAIDWLNKNHFDYRGLIPMGLAKDATGKAIYSYENNNQKTI